MNPRDFLAKWKTHLFFVSALLFVLTFNITIGFRAGQTFLGATWRAISEIRPMEYANCSESFAVESEVVGFLSASEQARSVDSPVSGL